MNNRGREDSVRISLFAGRLDDPQRVLSVEAATAVAAEHGAAMLVLPGYSLGREKANGCVLQQFADKTGVSILAETTHTFWFRPNQGPVGPFVQRFRRSKDATKAKVQEVAQGLVTGKRIIRVGRVSISVLLCGENNVLRNIQKKDNEPQPRHPDVGWPLGYDVLVNPAHTSMGQWNKLHKRFAYFSQSGRVLLYCTNNTCSSSWKTSLCVYRDGKKVVMGDLKGDGSLLKHEGKVWRLVTIEIP
jgi:hypothetical protein